MFGKCPRSFQRHNRQMHCRTRCLELYRAPIYGMSRSSRSNSRICSQAVLSSASIKEHVVNLWIPRSFTRIGYGESLQTDSETCHGVYDIYSHLSCCTFHPILRCTVPSTSFSRDVADGVQRNLPVSSEKEVPRYRICSVAIGKILPIIQILLASTLNAC